MSNNMPTLSARCVQNCVFTRALKLYNIYSFIRVRVRPNSNPNRDVMRYCCCCSSPIRVHTFLFPMYSRLASIWMGEAHAHATNTHNIHHRITFGQRLINTHALSSKHAHMHAHTHASQHCALHSFREIPMRSDAEFCQSINPIARLNGTRASERFASPPRNEEVPSHVDGACVPVFLLYPNHYRLIQGPMRSAPASPSQTNRDRWRVLWKSGLGSECTMKLNPIEAVWNPTEMQMLARVRACVCVIDTPYIL